MPTTESNTTFPVNGSPAEPPRRRKWGRWVVIGMLLFAVGLTVTNWVYWKLHVAPFLPLQKLLAEEYEGSRPRVEGGQRKIHKGTPTILRVTMKVDFDPTGETGDRKADRFSAEVARFIRENYEPLADYEILELHFYWPQPEQEIRQSRHEFAVDQLLAEKL